MRMTRVGRKYQRRINREMTILGLQAIANEIQSKYDSREMTHAEACEFRKSNSASCGFG